jgi:hypothetical protein
MDVFTAAVIGDLVATLTAGVIKYSGRKLREAWQGTETQQAIRRCLNAGVVAVLAQATAASPDEQQLLADILQDFFRQPDTASEIARLFRGRRLDYQLLDERFEDAGYDAQTLPGLPLNESLHVFEAAVLLAAAEEPAFQQTIQTDQLLQQTGLQRAILEQLDALVAILQHTPDGVAV